MQGDWEALDESDRDLAASLPVTTHWAPSYSVHPRTGDVYPGINKPVAVIDWLANTEVRRLSAQVKEDYVLVIDADMVMRRPILPQVLLSVSNELALRHIPQVAPRNDSQAGPAGRRGDQVGGFTLMATADMRRVAPLWLKLSEDVREDPLAWNLTGDHYALEGDKPWIAEMYGYSFGCAAADVWHIANGRLMRYPGYAVDRETYEDPPSVLHYGILWNVSGTDYAFDKHWHYDFDALACPPWNMSDDPRLTKRGLFAHPPRPSAFNTTGLELMRDLLAIEVLVTLNEAFCERHRRACPPSDELGRECSKAEAIAQELRDAYASLPPLPPDPEPAQYEVPPPDEAGADAGAAGEAASEAEAAAEAAAEEAAVEEVAAEAAAAGGQQQAAEAAGEPEPPSQADRPRAPSEAHIEL
ncbi:hypothetical protein COHA_007303 [Chlorella ohadii]|uniref:Hydroxyproline O-arabinosyltransferase-like domain-containing protein n=1 Tax=Chlorella ohadii TaxID=2649997 RepID=A0AAD5DMC6_9CHLO|nr:hypothetical protein COHA_007303 [Chlorella ohadii]